MKITAQDLRVQLGGREILRGLDIAAEDGQFVGIIGPNGSGKSALLRCIGQILTPAAGAVYLDGRPAADWPPREWARKLGVVAWNDGYSFDFTVREVVSMGRGLRGGFLRKDAGEDGPIVREAIAAVGMAGCEERRFSTLSGGEQQRIILARALAQQTPCLLLDEPTGRLDVRRQMELMDLVKGLGKTVLAAIQDLNIAAMHCDRLYAVKDGRVVAEGTPREVLTEEVIRAVYQVDAQALADRDGVLHILFRPLGRH